ncbi:MULTISPECIES: hypothetical protein [Bacillus]|uniref:hypothetical protein n=1 Tax=Bacillus TaxID=1386 RepID=UPI00077ACB60|nr:hypothetical protein [Bacillus cereus]KXY63498.1 hypothetical protein AT275_00240 [Bacillus cereus]
MGFVITVNKIEEKPNNFEGIVIGREEVQLEGSLAVAETRIYKPTELQEGEEEVEEVMEEEVEDELDEDFIEVFPDEELETGNLIPGGDIVNYEKYILKHSQKYPIVGVINQREFKEILRVFSFEVYINNSYAISYSKHKGKFAQSAFKRLKDTTAFKSVPYELDLLDALENIINSDSGITIQAGWFANLGLANLDSVLLRGEDVNQAADWKKFKRTAGASLSNIELLVEDSSFPNNRIAISLSKRGILYCKRNISPEKSLELTDRIFKIVLGEEE